MRPFFLEACFCSDRGTQNRLSFKARQGTARALPCPKPQGQADAHGGMQQLLELFARGQPSGAGTQTTLTKLAELVANVHGELAFVEGLLAQADVDAVGRASPPMGLTPEVRLRLEARRLKLVADRYELYATVRQFDSSIDPARIGALDEWKLQFGRKGLGVNTLVARYLLEYASPQHLTKVAARR